MLPYWLPNAYKSFKGFYNRKRSEYLIPDTDKNVMLPKTRKYLEAYFADEVRKIEALTDRSLADLWYSVHEHPAKGKAGCRPEDAA